MKQTLIRENDQLDLFSQEPRAELGNPVTELSSENQSSSVGSGDTHQLSLAWEESVPQKESKRSDSVWFVPERTGRAVVTLKPKSAVLSRAGGFMSDYDFTLNPYSGCQFGCAYCYAAFFVNDDQKRQDWGLWVEVKEDAVRELSRSRSVAGAKVYMSSVTDPYQPLEAKVGLTRQILEVLVSPLKMPRLVVQTRSPLVTRDLDLLKRLDHVRINMTITTDSESVRKRFEPSCPSNELRLEALREAKKQGLKICACITPMLPLEDPSRFADTLAALEADIYVAQPFKPSTGRFAAGTRGMALDIAQEFGWTLNDYERAFGILRARLPHLYEGKEGFAPE